MTAVRTVHLPARPAKLAALLLVAALTLGLAGTSAYAAAALGGGGSQPEDVLPRDALGFVKIDLDPSAGQKLAAYQIARKFPSSGAKSPDSLRDDLLRSVFGVRERAEYEAYVKPWLGQRAGVAFLRPQKPKSDEPVLVAAVQVTDRAKADAGLRALARRAKPGSDVTFHAFGADKSYVLLSDDKAAVNRAAAQRTSLADNPRFTKSVDELGGDQIVLGWLDVTASWRAVPAKARTSLAGGLPLDLRGAVVFGAHVTDGTVEVLTKTVDFSAGDSPQAKRLFANPIGRGTSSGLIRGLPGDSVAAASATGLGAGLAALYQDTPAVRRDKDLRAFTKAAGLKLPADIKAVFGTELAVSASAPVKGGAPAVHARVETGNAARALAVITRIEAVAQKSQPSGSAVLTASGKAKELSVLEHGRTASGYVARYGPLDTRPPGRVGELGDSEVFQRTLPDLDASGMTFYVDVARLVQSWGALTGGPGNGSLSVQQRKAISPLLAAGSTTTVAEDGDTTNRLRLTVAR